MYVLYVRVWVGGKISAMYWQYLPTFNTSWYDALFFFNCVRSRGFRLTNPSMSNCLSFWPPLLQIFLLSFLLYMCTAFFPSSPMLPYSHEPLDQGFNKKTLPFFFILNHPCRHAWDKGKCFFLSPFHILLLMSRVPRVRQSAKPFINKNKKTRGLAVESFFR